MHLVITVLRRQILSLNCKYIVKKSKYEDCLSKLSEKEVNIVNFIYLNAISCGHLAVNPQIKQNLHVFHLQLRFGATEN